MDDPPRTTQLHSAPAESAVTTNLTTFLQSLVPPYFLKWGPHVGAWYALASLTGFLCHMIFMVLVITWTIAKGLDWLISAVTLRVPLSAIANRLNLLPDAAELPTWFVLSFIGWWLVSSLWMAVTYRRHQDGTRGWRVYILGGGWAWRFWKRGNSDGDFDFDFD